MRTGAGVLVFAGGSFLLSFSPCAAGPIEDLPVGRWVELPCQNKIRDVLPDPVPPGNGPDKIIDAWNSGAYDTRRERYLIHGGGHSDYAGNEIYAFDLTSLRWTRLTEPDGTPTSVHTYDTLEYLPRKDWFFRQGGCGWGPACPTTDDVWAYDLTIGEWTKKNDPLDGASLGNVSAYDLVTGHVFWDGAGNSTDRMREYDPDNNVWTQRGADSVGNYHQTAALDPKRRLFLRVGGGEMNEYAITASGNCPVRSPGTTGPRDIMDSDYPGIEYDPVSESFVAWESGSTIYSYHPDAQEWRSHSTVGPMPPRVEQGNFNRWRYVPSKNVFIIVNDIDGNVFAYRHTAPASAPPWYLALLGGGLLPPEQTPMPSRPRRLRVR